MFWVGNVGHGHSTGHKSFCVFYVHYNISVLLMLGLLGGAEIVGVCCLSNKVQYDHKSQLRIEALKVLIQ